LAEKRERVLAIKGFSYVVILIT